MISISSVAFSFEEIIQQITQSLNTSISGFTTYFMSIAGNIVGALFLLLVGWLVARLVGWLMHRILKAIKFDELIDRLNLTNTLQSANIKSTPSKLTSKFIYWIIFLLFFIMATNILGLTIISEKLNELINFIPTLLTGILLFVFGYYVASFLRDIIVAATSSMGFSGGRMIASFVFYFMMVIVSITALDQLGVDTTIISNNIVMILGAILATASISYGFASRDILANMLAGFFSRKIFREGQHIRLDDVEGKIIAVDNISVTVQTQTDKVVIPTVDLINNRVHLLDYDQAPKIDMSNFDDNLIADK